MTYSVSRPNLSFSRVIILAAIGIIPLSGCTQISPHYQRECNSRAYISNDLSSYLSARFPKNSPARMAIIPFSVPANLAAFNSENPGLGNDLAWRVHAAMLAENLFPIVEVFNRQDWPGKKEEFFTGNFGAISLAREAQYDLVMVGLLESARSINELSAYTKIIDTDSGVTLWYSRTNVRQPAPRVYRGGRLEQFIPSGRPDLLPTRSLSESLSYCIVDTIVDY